MNTLARIIRIGLIAVIIGFHLNAPLNADPSAPVPPEQTALRVEERYRLISSLTFSFTQTTSGEMSGRPKTGNGTGYFAKTDRKTWMRWNYNTPEHQVLISDGTVISMYFEKLKQMIIAPVDTAQSDILFSFFAGRGALSDDFLVLGAEETAEEIPEPPTGFEVVRLVPRRPHAQIRTIHLWIGADTLIRRIEILDHFDTKTTINLKDIEVDPLDVGNQAAIGELFSFTPPEGTEIIRQ